MMSDDLSPHAELANSLHFTPQLEWPWLAPLFMACVLLVGLSVFCYRRALVWRAIVFALFALVLANPSLLRTERSYTTDVAAILVDQSASQDFGDRARVTDEALSYIRSALEEINNLEIREVRAPVDGALRARTDLFQALDQAMADVPSRRRAGVIVISDGQIHDVPQNIDHSKELYGPVHLLLTGKKDERDRRIVVTNASAYGLVGQDISVTYHVEDTQNISQSEAHVTLELHDGTRRSFYIPVGEEQRLDLPISHAGQNVFTLSVDGVADEVTLANNKSALVVNGVRDRLKVLLISGIPHSGERTWRDLLTSDPGVDLVHFTILREPQKFDYTPRDELSLIAFPFDELFNRKLYDFDLIIFDQYRVNNILPELYFHNIVRYVRMGGAFLSANGPAFAQSGSIYNTPLRSILPGAPTRHITQEAFTPSVTALGHKHPVTRSLVWNGRVNEPDDTHEKPWGDWLRYIDITANRGDVLMSAGAQADPAQDKPLLILDRVDKGRVAQLSSDHIWLWSRGYDGGGPHAELLRRIVHWLMKEPELDEQAFEVIVNKDQITVQKPAFGRDEETISVQSPDGEVELLTLESGGDERGMLHHTMQAGGLGIYAFEDVQGLRKFAIVGDLNAPELDDVVTSSEAMDPLIKATGGAPIWLHETPRPDVGMRNSARRYGGNSWLSLRRNEDFTVARVRDIALLNEWLSLGLLLLALLLLWWKEGQKSK
ncbi:MAG: hypothetical protein ACLFP8_01505 [Alphaproteobacteria bacterium]